MEKIFKDNKDGTLNVSVSYVEQEYSPIINKVANHLMEKVTVKGFRTGKAPREMAIKYISNEDLYNGMVNKIIDKDFNTLLDGYDESVNVANIRPSLSVDFDEKKKIYNFIYVFYFLPIADIKKCEGYDVKLYDKKITDADVDAEINHIASDNAELVPSKEAAEMKDHVLIDFTGYVDGKEFDGGSANDYDLVLGSGAFVPGFEDALVGIKEGDKKTIEITFPKNYLASLAEKNAKFAITCKGVKKVVLPEINDDLAAAAQEYKVTTLEDLKKAVKEKLQHNADVKAKNEKINKVLELIKKDNKIVVSKKYIEILTNQVQQDQLNQFKQYNLDLDQYLKIAGLTAEQFKDNCKKNAVVQAEGIALIRGISKKANITWTEADLEAKFGGKEKYAEIIETAKKQAEKNPNFSLDSYLNSVKDSIISEKVNEYILKNN